MTGGQEDRSAVSVVLSSCHPVLLSSSRSRPHHRNYPRDDRDAENDDRREQRPLQREALVVVELHLDEADEQIRRWYEGTQEMHRLTDDGCATHFRRRDSVGG